MLYLSDFKKIENMTNDEKQKILKKFQEKDIGNVAWLDGALCISPIHLHVLAINPYGGRGNLCHTKWYLDGKPGEGWHNQEDKELIGTTKLLSQYMNNVYLKAMIKEVLTIDTDPRKDISKILEIANKYSNFLDINKYMTEEPIRRNMYHPSYLLGEYLIGLNAIHFSKLRTSILLRKVKYLDLAWKAADGLYWKDILRNYYQYPGEDDNNTDIKRVRESMSKTLAKGELEIQYQQNWFYLSSRLSNIDKAAAIAKAEDIIKEKTSCGGNFYVMGIGLGTRYEYLTYDNIRRIYDYDKRHSKYVRID